MLFFKGTKMTSYQRKQIENINALIREYRKQIHELLSAGVSSASLGSAGNSSSYTRLSVADYRREIAILEREKAMILGHNRRRSSPSFGN